MDLKPTDPVWKLDEPPTGRLVQGKPAIREADGTVTSLYRDADTHEIYMRRVRPDEWYKLPNAKADDQEKT